MMPSVLKICSECKSIPAIRNYGQDTHVRDFSERLKNVFTKIPKACEGAFFCPSHGPQTWDHPSY